MYHSAMAKPFRVKRGNKYIGSWLAMVKGERVNLETKDAEEARRRERRARAGDFGWRKEVAASVREALDGDSETVEEEALEEDSQGVASSEPAATEKESGPPSVAAGPPSPEPAPPPPDPVAEVNAAAAGMAEEIKETLAGAGINLGDLMDPEFLGGLHVGAQDVLFQLVAPMVTDRKPKPFVLPEKFAGAVKVLGQAWAEQLRRWNLSLDGVSPGAVILLATGGMLVAQVAALYAKETAAEGAPEVA